ncbi:MAG: inositol monophosphatase family protein, partial [Actinomycetota bacterium]
MAVDKATLMALADVADAQTLPLWRSTSLTHETKEDGSPVTDADRAAEAALLDALRERFPDDGFLGEETGPRRPGAPRRWVVDGIDGTGSFIAGHEEWSTLIAAVVDAVAVAGVVSGPAIGTRWWTTGGVAHRKSQ